MERTLATTAQQSGLDMEIEGMKYCKTNSQSYLNRQMSGHDPPLSVGFSPEYRRVIHALAFRSSLHMFPDTYPAGGPVGRSNSVFLLYFP